MGITGAQRLAACGVDVVNIMVIASCAGESILRCVREAPLGNLPEEVKALEEKRGLLAELETLQAEVCGIDTLVMEQQGHADRVVRELFATFGAADSRPDIDHSNLKRFKIHWAAINGWRTRCGVKFGRLGFTRHATKDGFPHDAFSARAASISRADKKVARWSCACRRAMPLGKRPRGRRPIPSQLPWHLRYEGAAWGGTARRTSPPRSGRSPGKGSRAGARMRGRMALRGCGQRFAPGLGARGPGGQAVERASNERTRAPCPSIRRDCGKMLGGAQASCPKGGAWVARPGCRPRRF